MALSVDIVLASAVHEMHLLAVVWVADATPTMAVHELILLFFEITTKLKRFNKWLFGHVLRDFYNLDQQLKLIIEVKPELIEEANPNVAA
jgi:hypothetical protein